MATDGDPCTMPMYKKPSVSVLACRSIPLPAVAIRPESRSLIYLGPESVDVRLRQRRNALTIVVSHVVSFEGDIGQGRDSAQTLSRPASILLPFEKIQ